MSIVAAEIDLVLNPEMAGALLTPEEFDAAEKDPDDGSCYELVHGVLVVTPIPADAEVGPNELLGNLLFLYKEHHPQGAALDATLTERYVRLSNGRRRADRSIWAGLGRRPDTRSDVQTIAVEFVSAGKRSWRRDDVENCREYAALGVREYWVNDRFQRTMTVYGKDVSATGERVIAEHEVYTTPLLPGFEMPLARILAAADAWS